MISDFKRIMEEQQEIALATSVEGNPNVRIVNFYFDTEGGILYFSSFKYSSKIKEIERNSKISFTTIPKKNEEHVRVQNGIAQKSKKTIYDLRNEFINKLPSYTEIIDNAGEQLELFEIKFEEATVTLDYQQKGKVKL